MEPATILLVDDNPVNLSILRTLLGKDGHELIAADGGQAAMELVSSNPTFDLILLDVALPDLDGIEVCRRLKQDEQTAGIPIVLVSAVRTDDESIRRGLEAGADGYLTKPIDDVALRAWVRATLRISRLQRELAERASMSGGASHTSLQEVFATLSQKVNASLQALFAAATILSEDLPEDSPDRKLVTEILSHAERVAEIVASASYTARAQLDT